MGELDMSGTNWWQYGKWVYNIGRTGRYLPYSSGENAAVVTFINGMLELRPLLVPRVLLKAQNYAAEIAEQSSESLGNMLKMIGRSLKVYAPSDEEKELCDALIAATGDRKNRIATRMATLTVEVAPEGSGTVSGTGEHPLNSRVEITATPNRGYVFESWNDIEDTSATRTIVLEQDTTIVATFGEGTPRTITASGDGGTVEITNSIISDSIYDGDTLTLTAVPGEGKAFSHWGDDITDTNPVKVITVDGDAAYTAVFEDASQNEEQ